VHLVSQGEKRAVLSHLLKSGANPQTLVFTRTKHGANRLAEQLTHDGLQCAAIHGNKSQSARTRALEDFKAYKVQVLVATDIAARGLDISELPQVVNYELPHVPEDYVHRIGRTGRAGSTGQALSLVSDDEKDRLRAIEKVLGRKINVLPLDRTQIPRPSGEGKAREPRHVDPRSVRHSDSRRDGQRSGQSQPHSRGHGTAPKQGAGQARAQAGGGRGRWRSDRQPA
jgi:ATP-dependent RNA helicase RhlE